MTRWADSWMSKKNVSHRHLTYNGMIQNLPHRSGDHQKGARVGSDSAQTIALAAATIACAGSAVNGGVLVVSTAPNDGPPIEENGRAR